MDFHGLTSRAQVHVRTVIFTYPLHGRYMRFITGGTADMYSWISRSHRLGICMVYTWLSTFSSQQWPWNLTMRPGIVLMDFPTRLIWKAGKSIVVNFSFASSMQKLLLLLFAIVLFHRDHSEKVQFYAASAARVLKPRNVVLQKRFLGEVKSAFSGKTSYSMLFSMEKRLEITAETYEKWKCWKNETP